MTPDLPQSARSTKFSMFPLLWAATAFALGIVLAELNGVDSWWWFGGAVVFGIAAFVVRAIRSGNHLALVAVVFAGAFVHQFQISNVSEDRVRRIYDGGRVESATPVQIKGRLIGRPEPAYDGVFIRVAVASLIARKVEMNASGDVRLFIPLAGPEQRTDLSSLDLRSGVTIRTACELLREDQYLNPGVTPRQQLLDQQEIDATCTVKSPLLIEVIERPGWTSPIDLVYEQRARLIEEFRSRFSPKAAGVMIASLLGDKHFLDRDTAEVFRDGGTFHVLVISGLHITFIGGVLFWVVSFFTRNRVWQFVLVCGTLWLYTLAVGAEVPVVRASLMFTLLLLGRALYRQGTLLNTLGLCCLILLAWRPADLFSPSLQLTIVSVAAIVGMAFPLIEKLRAIGSWMPDASSPFPPNVPKFLRRFCETLYWRPHVWEIEKGRQIWRGRIFKSPMTIVSDGVRSIIAYLFEGVLVSINVQLWMVPLLVFYFHRVSPISVLLNLWVGIIIAAESFSAIFAVMFGQISQGLALPFAMLANGLNWLLIEVPRLFVDLESASFRVPVYPGYGKAIYLIYLLPVIALAALVYRWDPFSLTSLRRVGIASTAAVSVVTVALASLIVLHPNSHPLPSGDLQIEFLDVGQGDSAFITFPNGETMLIDGGGRVNYGSSDEDVEAFEPDTPRIGEMVVSEFLWEKGYSRIDRLVVSHADADHSQGLTDIVRNFSVGKIMIGAVPASDSEMAELLAEADRYSIPVSQLGKGDNIEISGVRIDVLWPISTSQPTGSDNNSSLVLKFTFGELSVLFTGDIEKEAEAEILAKGFPLGSDLVKVPHHGSRTSSTQGFVDAISPKIAIIPVGRRSMFGHPHPEVVERWRQAGVEVTTTGSKGTITVKTNGNTLTFETFLP